jgi:hypothetical protein
MFRHLLESIILPSGIRIERFIFMIFDNLDERNVTVRSISHFDNFTKWKILVVNTSVSVLAWAYFIVVVVSEVAET